MNTAKKQNLSQSVNRDQVNGMLRGRNTFFNDDRDGIFCINGLSGFSTSIRIRHENGRIEPAHGQIHFVGSDFSVRARPQLRAMRIKKFGRMFQNLALRPHRKIHRKVVFSLEIRGFVRNERHRIAPQAPDAVKINGLERHNSDQVSCAMQQRFRPDRSINADSAIRPMPETFFAVNPLIRPTLPGIRGVFTSGVVAARAFGARPSHGYQKMELPLSISTILAGLNKTFMSFLSMPGIAVMISVTGSGNEVLRTLARKHAGNAIVGGLATVILSIFPVRFTKRIGHRVANASTGIGGNAAMLLRRPEILAARKYRNHDSIKIRKETSHE